MTDINSPTPTATSSMVSPIGASTPYVNLSSGEYSLPEEVYKGDDRSFWFILQGEAMDTDHDIMDNKEMEKMMDTLIKRGGPIHLGHTWGKHVGQATDWKHIDIVVNGKDNTKVKVPGILMKGYIFDDYRMDNKVWESIYDGDIQMVSVGTLTYKKQNLVDEDGDIANHKGDFEPFHIALAKNAGKNPFSFIIKAGDKLFTHRLSSRNISLDNAEMLMKSIRSTSLNTIGYDQAEMLVKSMLGDGEHSTEQEDTTMSEEVTTPEAPVQSGPSEEEFKELKTAVMELKELVETQARVISGLFDEDGMVKKELVYPVQNVGVNKKADMGGEPVFKGMTPEQFKDILKEVITDVKAQPADVAGETPEATENGKDPVTDMKEQVGEDDFKGVFIEPTLENLVSSAGLHVSFQESE